MDDLEHEQPIDLGEYIAILRVRKWLIVLVTLISLGAALVLSAQQTPLYRAQSRLLIEPFAANPKIGFVSLNLETEAEFVRSTPVARLAAEKLQLGDDPNELLNDLTVTVVPSSTVMEISYTSTDAAEAANVANAFADGYLTHRTRAASERITSAQNAVQARIDTVQDQLTEISNRLDQARIDVDEATINALEGEQAQLLARLGVLEQEMSDLAPNDAIQVGGGQVIEAAAVPSSPSSPNHKTAGVLGFLFGLMVGIGLAFLRERLDNRFRQREDVERTLKIPVLITIPRFKTGGPGAVSDLPLLADPAGAASESYRSLRTNVQFLAAQRGTNSLLVTSPSPSEGKTMTVANLGVSLAQAGLSVALVSADLRKPTVDRHFGVPKVKGLSEWILGAEPPNPGILVDTGIGGLRLVPAGEIPLNPAELLTSSRLVQLLAWLQSEMDWVIVDSPPVLPVADASILGSRLGGTILVLDSRTSTRSAAKHAKEELERVGARILGVALNALEPKSSRYGYYDSYRSGRYYKQYALEEIAENGRKRNRKKHRAAQETSKARKG